MELQIPSLPVLTFFLFIIMVWRIRKKLEWNNQSSTPNPPPGLWKLPFIGNLHQLVSFLPHHRLRQLANIYGPVMHLQLGELSFIVISSPETAKEVIKTHENFFFNKPQVPATTLVFYNSRDIFFAPHGDSWRQLRKICTLKLLSARRVQSFRSIRDEEVSKFINSISSKEGLAINLSEMIFYLLNEITVRACIGKKCRNGEKFTPIIEKMLPALIGFNIADIFPSVKLFHLTSWTMYKLKRVHREADKILEAMIYERRAQNAATNTEENESEDLLGALLNIQEHGNMVGELPVTNEDIKAIILEMFIAGSETTSTIVEWAMAEMLKNPTVMEKTQKEVKEVYNNMKTVDETLLHELKFLKLVIKETMRLHPPVALNLRECLEGCKIKGYDIQARSKVMINIWAIGRDPNYWNEADKFQPERFLDSSVDYKGAHFEFIPFGAGKRMCPGMLFATAIIELTLAKLLYHFDWKLPNVVKNEDLDMTEKFCSTVRKKQNLIVIPKSCYSAGN